MTTLTLSELARAVWRRRFWFLVPAVLGLLGGIAALQVLPRTYRAATQVLVEAQKVPADYVKPTTTTSIEERLHTMEPQIKSRDNMTRIIREMNLYPELRRQGVPIDGLIDHLREDLTIRLQGDTFFIYFVGREPVKVAKTANRVAELFIENNLEQRTNQAQGTSSFLERELAQTKTKLEQQEARIADFKRLNMGDLPEQRDTNLHAVEQLQSKLQINMDALDRAETRKLLLQRQIAELGYPLDSRPATAKPPAGPTRLEQARQELAELRARYTDRHPDVIRAQAEVAHLEALERQKPAESPSATAADDAPAPQPRLDPTTKAELASVDLEIRSLKAERERILSDTAAIQARLENVPRVEQELLSLTRDYDNIRRSYDSLLDKRLNAKLYENLEKSQQGEQFTILERALPPNAPYGPNKVLVLALGLGLGGAAGLLLAMLRDRTDPTYADAASLQQAFPGVPLLATIPPFRGARTAPRAWRI